MVFDGSLLKAVVRELNTILVGGRVSKIYQPFEQEIHLVVRNHRKNHRLIASIHPQYYRLHLTEDRPTNPQQAPMFAMLLRKHLEGAELLAIRQIENDRIVIFEFTGRDEFGDSHHFELIIELMGRHSNLVLTTPNNRRIIDCIKHVPAYLNSYRLLLPGAEYIQPPTNDLQTNIFDLNATDLLTFANQHADAIKKGQAGKFIQGVGRPVADHLKTMLVKDGKSTYTVLKQFIENIQNPTPATFLLKGQPNFYAFPLAEATNVETNYPNLSILIDKFYAYKVKRDRIKQVTGDLIQHLHYLIEHNNHKLKNLAKDRQQALDAETYQLKGELLNAYHYKIEPGLTEVVVENYYDNNKPYTIALDPKKSAIENSQTYFKQYNKYRDALSHIDGQIEATKLENDYLETVLVAINQADLDDIPEIRQELASQGYTNQKQNSHKKRSQTKSKPRQFKSTDGDTIYVGRNNKQNDELSMRRASKNHWWLHTKDIPGSHVIIASDNPSQQTFEEAAALAAYYSKSQYSANVPVDTVQVKHLRKPNGAKPGYVIYEGQETLFVTPSETLVQKLSV